MSSSKPSRTNFDIYKYEEELKDHYYERLKVDSFSREEFEFQYFISMIDFARYVLSTGEICEKTEYSLLIAVDKLINSDNFEAKLIENLYKYTV